MKKVLSTIVVVFLALAVLLSGCKTTPSNSTEENTVDNTENQTPKKIGVIQTVTHPALDASRDGFIDALAANGYVEGENIVIDRQDGQGDQSNLKSISQKFVSDACDLILAIATPAAQSIAAETKDIPILITAVTDPEDAKLVVSNEDTQTNVTGTSDMAPYKEQLDLMMTLLPDTKTLAVIYTSSEPNSVIQAQLVEEYAVNSLGLTVEHKTISSSNDIDQVAQSVVGKADAIYAPTDNTIAAAMPTLAKVSVENNIPIICAEEGMVAGGGLASVSINYYQLGYKTGEMAAKILNGEATPKDMPIEYAPNPQLIFNAAVFNAFGMEIPAELSEGATIINE